MASKSLGQLIEDISALSVIELAELVKELKEKFGVSSMVAAVAAPEAGPAVAAEKTEYKVELIDGGAEKLKVIKALRTVKKDLGLIDAKKIVESAPVVLEESCAKDIAQALQKELEAAGAKVKLS